MDSNLEKLRATTKDQPNIFLIQEFERILTNISCLVEYKMDLFICEIVCDNYVIKKYMYSKRKNFLLIYRGLLFLLERRFETFMKFNVILFKHIIQDFWTEKSFCRNSVVPYQSRNGPLYHWSLECVCLRKRFQHQLWKIDESI